MARHVTTYDQFLGLLEEVGFLFFSGEKGVYLRMGDVVDPHAWHTGDPDTDPWAWKDRICESRAALYSRILAGQQTLVAWDWVSAFWAAYRAPLSIRERYDQGAVDPLTYRMATLFEEKPEWARHELTAALGISGKGKAKFEGALKRLQMELYITASGQSQRTAWNGAPIGWPSMAYMRADCYIDPSLVARGEAMGRIEALQRIREKAISQCEGLDARALKRIFRIEGGLA